MFDAYTVKKVLPRLAIAVILIQLSWFITTGAIFITNKIAFGIEGLMYGAFGGSANFTLDTLLSSSSSSSATTIGLSTLFVVAGTAFGGGVIAIGGFIIIAVIVAFLSLAVRRAILILLILLSPIAIVCWILPNTERFWKMWWDNFTKLLIMFPLIMGMIAAGRIFAKISGEAGGSDIIKTTLIIAGFFVPLLLIPKTFALAGSAFAAMGGAIAQRGAGAQNWAQGVGKNRQKKKWAKRGQDFTAGDLAKRNNIAARAINRVGAGVGAGRKGAFGVGRRGREARAMVAQKAAARNAKENESLQNLSLNSDEGIAIQALSGGTKAGGRQAADELMAGWLRDDEAYQTALATGDHATANARLAHQTARRDRGLAAAQAVGFSRQNAEAGMSLMMQNKARAVGAGDWQTVQNGVNRLHGNNAEAAASLAGTAQYHARGATRFDLGDTTATAGAGRGSLYQLANSHPNTITALGQEVIQGIAGGTPEELEAGAVFRQELDAMIPNSTGDARAALVAQREAIDGASGGLLRTYMDSDLPPDPVTGAIPQTQERINYEPAMAAAAVAAGAPVWTADDIARGWRTEVRNQTNADLAHRNARTYQRPREEDM